MISDRMVSVGPWGVEMPAHKPYVLYNNKETTVMAVGAGTLSVISEYLRTLTSSLGKEESLSMLDVAKKANDEYVNLLREKVQREVLDPFHIDFDDFVSQNGIRREMYDDIEYRIRTDTMRQYFRDLGVLVAGVDESGPMIFTIEDSLKYRESGRVGFDAIGSGFESADWTLMHRQFDANKDLFYALQLGMYAKLQAEESSGVGRDTDAYIIQQGKITEVPENILDSIRKDFEADLKAQKLRMDESIKKMRDGKNEWKEIR